MKTLFPLLACLLLPFAALAQSETCPRVWRSGDSLLTDPAPRVQWLRDGQPIPDANERWLLPTEAGRYSVQATGAPSEAFTFSAENRYALAGYVFDELHRPIDSATVRSGTVLAMTDARGRFVLSLHGAKPAERTPVVLTVEKDGYWRNASRQYISRFDTTETHVMLHARRVSNHVDATKGGEMAYRGFTLQLPPNAVQTESGTPYSGTILLSVEGATPSDPDFGLRMPGGDFSAINEDGNDIMLYSYGYLSAEMTAESGEKLELRPEARATLRFHLPYTETLRPDSVPLWHFNTETAVWEQEGWSVRNGSIYEGRVSHFSSWNCDLPAERSSCKGRVNDCNEQPVKGGWVRVGQRNVVTDGNGEYWAFVPSNQVFDIWTQSDTLRDISVPAQEERTLEDLTGLNFSGVAVYNPQTQALSVYLSGNVPDNLRLSIDGGQSWTEEREFTGIAAPPDEIWLNNGCTDHLQVVVMPKAGDCRMLTAEELATETEHLTLASALNAEQAFRLKTERNFRGEWNSLLHLGCLNSLKLEGNRLYVLPESIGNLTSLQWLYLSDNWLTSVPENLGNLVNLKELSLSGNEFITLPESFGCLTKLQKLNLIVSTLSSLPESFGKLVNLQELLISGSELTSLPESFDKLVSLQRLNLDNNKFTSVPESIGRLPTLRVLYMRYGQFTSLPENFGNLAALEWLDLESNQLTFLPESFGNLSALQSLRLHNNSLASLPESFGDLSSLQNLWLFDNQLTSLPESFGNLNSLQDLRLSDNELTALPESIGNLVNLQLLLLNNNQLASVPESIGNLVGLQTLSLNYCQLTSVPESIGNLSSLRVLLLEGNQLASLPESFRNLTSLEQLRLHLNQLTDLPSSLGDLASLRTLYLSDNQITDLPASFANLADTLRELYLTGNPIPVERRAAIQALLPNTTIIW